jgi:hypothetical protein
MSKKYTLLKYMSYFEVTESYLDGTEGYEGGSTCITTLVYLLGNNRYCKEKHRNFN